LCGYQGIGTREHLRESSQMMPSGRQMDAIIAKKHLVVEGKTCCDRAGWPGLACRLAASGMVAVRSAALVRSRVLTNDRSQAEMSASHGAAA